MLAYFEHIDRQLLLLINGWNSPFWDSVMVAISGTLWWIPFYLLLLFLLYQKQKNQLWLTLLIIGILILTADQISVHLFKNVFQRYRPCHNQEIKETLHLVNGVCGGKYGFVSSHAANTFALASFLGFVFGNKWAVAGLLVWSSIVSYSRIYLGVHYPFDVVGGAILGMVLGSLFYYLYHKFLGKKAPAQPN